MQKNKHLFQIIFAVTVFTALSGGFSHLAHADQPFSYTPLATIPNLTTAGTPITSPATYVQGLYVFAFSIGIVIAVVSGVWAGVEYMLSESVTSKEGAKKRITGVIWGFALLLCSYVILDLINPQLVSFNLNLGAKYNSQSNLSGDLAAQSAAQQAQQKLETTANNAVIQSRTAQQNLTTAQQNLQTAQAAFDQLQASGTASASDIAYATQAVKDALVAQGTAQSAAAQSAAAATTAQVEVNMTKDVNGLSGTDLLPANITTSIPNTIQAITQARQSADTLLNQQAVSAAGDPTTMKSIDALKVVVDSTASQAIALVNTQGAMNTIGNGPYQEFQSVQSALTTINSNQTQIDNLNSLGQATAAQALSQTTKTNLAALDSLVANSSVLGNCPSASSLSFNSSSGNVVCGH